MAAGELARAFIRGTSGSMAVAQTLVVRFITLGLNVVTGIVTARFLGPVGRADQAAILLGAIFIPYLISFGIPAAVQFKIRTDADSEKAYESAGIILTFSFGWLAFLIGMAVLPHMLAKYPSSVILMAQLAMLSAPVIMLYSLLCSILQARGRFREANITRYAMPALTLIALCILAMIHRLTPMSSAITYLITFFLAVPWLWTTIAPRLRLRGLKPAMKSLLNYGSKSYISDILGTLALQVDQILVIGLLSPASMGLYTVSLAAARSVDLYSSSIVAVLFPRAASLEKPQIVELTGRAVRITAAMLGITSILLIALIPFLLPLFYGKVFQAAVPVAQLVVVSFALNAVVYVLAQAYMAAGRPGVNAVIQLCGLATTIPAMLILIPKYALVGAAAALVISTVVRLCSTLACFPVVLKAQIPSLVLNRFDIDYVRHSIRHQMRTPAPAKIDCL